MKIHSRNRHEYWDTLQPDPHHETVPADLALTPAAQFARWLDALPPQFCPCHPRTRLELDRTKSEKHFRKSRGVLADSWPPPPAPVDYESLRRDFPSIHKRIAPKSSTPEVPHAEFIAYLCACPACKVEYAFAPPEFVETSFGDFEPRTPKLAACLAKCREFAAQVNAHNCGFALLCGFTGNGKTRLACNVIREVWTNDCLYITQARATILHRETYGQRHHYLHRNHETKDDVEAQPAKTIWSVASDVQLLVLDEIGTNALASDELLLLDDLLKHRYDHRKPTILISNLALTGTPERPGVKEFLGDALTDRIAQAAGNGKFILQFDDPSYRRETGEDYLAGLGSRQNA